jgi:hypothetical protein
MNISLLIYLISMLDPIGKAAFGLAWFWGTYCVLKGLLVCDPSDDPGTGINKFIKESCTVSRVCVLFFLILFATLIPTPTTAAAMYLVPKLANNEVVQQVPEAVKALFEKWTKDLVSPQKGGN